MPGRPTCVGLGLGGVEGAVKRGDLGIDWPGGGLTSFSAWHPSPLAEAFCDSYQFRFEFLGVVLGCP